MRKKHLFWAECWTRNVCQTLHMFTERTSFRDGGRDERMLREHVKKCTVLHVGVKISARPGLIGITDES
jgi:hypothetical protein